MSWLADRARRRFCRAICDVWVVRQDARGLAFHLSQSLPHQWATDTRVPLTASLVRPAAALITTHKRGEHITARGSLQRAAAGAEAMEFHVTDVTRMTTFTVFVVQDSPYTEINDERAVSG